jgi:hypothetical protein
MDENNNSSKPSVSGAKSSQAIYHLIFNAVIPGLGSLIYTRFLLFIPLFIMFAGAVSMFIFMDSWSKLYAVIILVLWWITSLGGGIYYYLKDPWNR